MNKKNNKETPLQTVGYVAIALALAIGWMWISSKVPETDKRHSAYYAACNFIETRYVAVKKCSEFETSVITDNGNNKWSVGIRAVGVNLFNAPIQKFITVQMEWNGNDRWTLKDIEQW